MKRLALILGAAAIAAASASPALADIVYNKPPTGLDSHRSDDTQNLGLIESYDHFTLGEDTTLTNIAWSGADQLDAFFIVAIFSDNNGSPGILLNGVNAGTANKVYGMNEFDYITAIDFAANANVTYWLSIYSVNSLGNEWDWGNSATGDNMAQTYIPTSSENPLPGGFYPLHDNLAFTLLGAATVHTPPPPPPAVTPEPASLVLMGSGMLTMAGMVRRRLTQRQ